jgi:hypothetical protein
MFWDVMPYSLVDISEEYAASNSREHWNVSKILITCHDTPEYSNLNVHMLLPPSCIKLFFVNYVKLAKLA